MPGLSCCHEPKAAFPFSSVPFPSSAAEEDALAFASTRRAAAAVLTMLCIRTLHQDWTSRGITIIDRALSSGSIHPRTNSITTARGHPRRLATCSPACHDGRQFWQAAGTSAGQLTIVSVAVVLERLFGAALSKYCRPDVAVRPVQRTIRIRIDRHAGGFPLLSVGRMSDELAGATELQCFGRSGRRY
jgi:hypothetical protein